MSLVLIGHATIGNRLFLSDAFEDFLFILMFYKFVTICLCIYLNHSLSTWSTLSIWKILSNYFFKFHCSDSCSILLLNFWSHDCRSLTIYPSFLGGFSFFFFSLFSFTFVSFVLQSFLGDFSSTVF